MGKFTKLTVLAVLIRRTVRYFKHSFSWIFNKLRGSKAVTTKKQSNSRLSKFQRHLLTNMIIGLFIAVALHFMQHSAYLTQLEDTALDWTMQMYRGTVPKDKVTPVAFIDIDDASYSAWGEQLITPRDKLARLIEHAIEGEAKAIVIDIDISRPSDTGDEQLQAVLAAYQANESELDQKPPPLILTRVFKPPSLRENNVGLNQEKISFLDSLVSKSSNIYWAMSVYDLELDGKVRNWHLWQAVCDQNQKPVVYPSVQLLVKVLLTEDTNLVSELYDRLLQMTPSHCEINQPTSTTKTQNSVSESISININDEELSLEQNQTGRRIIYRIPWLLGQDETRPLVPLKSSQNQSIKVPQLSTLSAQRIADSNQKASPDWLHNHLVIIGASHADSRDLYQTPIGLMPGGVDYFQCDSII